MTSFNPATPLGYSDVPPGHVASVVTCLEMRAKPDAPAVRLPEGVTIVPMTVETREGDVSIRAKDPAYATPGPDETQKFP